MSGATVGTRSESVVCPDSDQLADLLNVGPLTLRRPCHGYATGCLCERCETRAYWFAEGLTAKQAKELAAEARYL